MFNRIDKSKLAPVAHSQLVNGQRYLMVDTEHAVVVTAGIVHATESRQALTVQIAKSFLVGFFAVLHTPILVDQIGGSVQFFSISEDVA
jgi:hypothetical protein